MKKVQILMLDYQVKVIPANDAKEYIRKNHYSHGSHNGPSPCFGLFDGQELIGVLMFATPCSENVRRSVFGAGWESHVTELHRLHIQDVTPHNAESWFIARCFHQLKKIKPDIYAVLSFSDTTEGHNGTIYKATNAYRIGQTGMATFYRDCDGRLRHPRQCGVNITRERAKTLGWIPERRYVKNRYLWLLPNSKKHKKQLISMCRYDIRHQSFN